MGVAASQRKGREQAGLPLCECWAGQGRENERRDEVNDRQRRTLYTGEYRENSMMKGMAMVVGDVVVKERRRSATFDFGDEAESQSHGGGKATLRVTGDAQIWLRGRYRCTVVCVRRYIGRQWLWCEVPRGVHVHAELPLPTQSHGLWCALMNR